MTVGCLGNVQFEVSDRTVLTLNNLAWSSSASYATHSRHNSKSLAEYTGLDADKLKFDIVLSTMLGVRVDESLHLLNKYQREGRILPLVIGHTVFGKYRWVIDSYTVKIDHMNGRGNIIEAKVSLALTEYVKIKENERNTSNLTKPMNDGSGMMSVPEDTVWF